MQSVGAFFQIIQNIIQVILPVIAITMVIFSALIYTGVSIFGAETRAQSNVWATNFLVSAAIAVVLYTTFTGFFPKAIENFPARYLLYKDIVLSVLIGLTGIIVLSYAIARIFNNPQWQAYWGVEISSLLGSVVVVLFVVSFFEVVNGISSTMTAEYTGSFDTAPAAASAFLERILIRNIYPAVNDLFTIQICLSHLSTFQRRIGEFVLTLTYKLFPAVDSIVSITNVIVFGFVAILGSVSTQIAILDAINATMAPFVLPAGVVLRFIPVTRRAGTFLIALAIGFQAIFPMTYVLNIKALEILGFSDYQTPKAVYGLCLGDLATLGLAGNPPVIGQLPLVRHVTTVVRVLFTELGVNLLRPLEFAQFMKDVSYLSLVALFMPAFSTTITFAFINAFDKFVSMKVE